MSYIIGCLMAALSFLLNRAFIKWFGSLTIISCGPLIEEVAKTLPAYLLNADILITHTIFGCIEGIYDWYGNKGAGLLAAVISIAGHSLFGGLTIIIFNNAGSIWLAIATALAAHILWNVTVIRWDTGRGGKKKP